MLFNRAGAVTDEPSADLRAARLSLARAGVKVGFLVCESRWVIVEPVGFLGFGWRFF